jgi:hypothetical protein
VARPAAEPDEDATVGLALGSGLVYRSGGLGAQQRRAGKNAGRGGSEEATSIELQALHAIRG